MAETAEAGVPMHYFDIFPDYNIPKHWKEREDRRHCRLPINDEKGDMVYFESIRKIMNSCTTLVGMGDYNHLVASIDELCRELVDVTFNSSKLWKEEVADHGNVVRHLGRDGQLRPTERQSRKAASWRGSSKDTHGLQAPSSTFGYGASE